MLDYFWILQEPLWWWTSLLFLLIARALICIGSRAIRGQAPQRLCSNSPCSLLNSKAVIFVPTFPGLIQNITHSAIAVIGYLNGSVDCALGLQFSILRVVFGRRKWRIVACRASKTKYIYTYFSLKAALAFKNKIILFSLLIYNLPINH